MTTSKVSLPNWVQQIGALSGYGRRGEDWGQGSYFLASSVQGHFRLAAALNQSQFQSDAIFWFIVTTLLSYSFRPDSELLVHCPMWFSYSTLVNCPLLSLPEIILILIFHVFPAGTLTNTHCYWVIEVGLELRSSLAPKPIFLPLHYSYTLTS